MEAKNGVRPLLGDFVQGGAVLIRGGEAKVAEDEGGKVVTTEKPAEPWQENTEGPARPLKVRNMLKCRLFRKWPHVPKSVIQGQ